jgi:hypothetical protein
MTIPVLSRCAELSHHPQGVCTYEVHKGKTLQAVHQSGAVVEVIHAIVETCISGGVLVSEEKRQEPCTQGDSW